MKTIPLQRTMEAVLERFERGELTRRQAGAMAVAAVLGAAGASEAAEPTAGKPLFQTTELNHIALRVTDLDRSQAFYEETLGLKLARSSPWNRFMTCGRHFLALFRSEKAGLDHYAFGWPEYTQKEAARRLRGAGIEPTLQGNRIYFEDPDGHTLQISWDEDWPGSQPRPKA